MMERVVAIAAHPGPWRDGEGWHGNDDAPAWWPVFPITFGLFWLAVGIGVFILLRRKFTPKNPSVAAQGVLAERYAKGEIDEEEYHERSAVLRKRDED